MNTLLTALTLTVLTVASLGLAHFSYRQFGITSIIWVILVKASSFAASSIMTISTQHFDAEKVIQQWQDKFNTAPADLFLTLIAIPQSLHTLSSLCVLLMVAAEFNHFGPKLSSDYQPRPILSNIYRRRVTIGLFAVLFACAPSLLTIFIVKTMTP
jgi:hypothetical protein